MKQIKKVAIALVILVSTVFSTRAAIADEAAAPPKRKALVVISSAKYLELTSPSGVPRIQVGFYLVELARMLQAFEAEYDFTFVTPDGQAPQIDVNGLDLNFHIQGPHAPWANAMANFRNNDYGTGHEIREFLGWNESVEAIRSHRSVEYIRRQGEIETAAKHLGDLSITEPLPNTNPEAREFRAAAVERLAREPKKRYLSLSEVIAKHRDASDEFKLSQFDFVYVPGGHAPMVDLIDNPQLGEVLNVLHEAGKTLVAICHGPIALSSAQFRVSATNAPLRLRVSPLKGANVTTVSSFEERLMLNLGYIHQPSLIEKTKLAYFVDRHLVDAGFRLSYGSPLVAGVQALPGFPHFVIDSRFNIITGNGPQVIDVMVERMLDLHRDGKL